MRAGLAEARRRGIPVHADEVVEPFGSGWQIRDKRGFRPCPWAVDLARFAPLRGGDRVLDLGCGNGVLLRAIGDVCPEVRLRVGVELAARASGQAARNARLDDHGGFGVVRADLRRLPLRPRFDLVVANPPFYPPDWGRRSAHAAVDRSTHALHGDVADFARAAAHALVPHGQAAFVFDSDHLTALLLAMSGAGLTPRAMRFLDDDRGRPSRVLVRASRGGTGLAVDRQQPVVIEGSASPPSGTAESEGEA